MTIVSSGQTLTISSGVTSNGDVVQPGGTEVILSGGMVLSTIFSNSGIEIVSSGGLATSTTGAGSQTVFGSATGTALSNGGQQYVSSGGVAFGTTLGANGTQLIYNGGLASGATISANGRLQMSGGVASGTTVSSGGNLSVYSGAAFDTVIASSGFAQVVGGSASASNVTIASGGSLSLFSGGFANGTIVDNGTITLTSGGMIGGSITGSGTISAYKTSALAPNLSGFGGTLFVSDFSRLEVSSGGSLGSGSVVLSGAYATLQIDGTSAPTGALVSLGGGARIDLRGLSDPAATGQIVGGTTLRIVGGGNTYNFTLTSPQTGSVHLASDGFGGTAIGIGATTVVSAGVTSSNNSVSISSFQDVYGTTSNAFVDVSAEQDIYSGGIATSSYLYTYSIQQVFNGGRTTGTNLATARQDIFSGGVAVATSAYTSSIQNVWSGGIASNTLLYSGSQTVYAGGLAVGTQVSSNGSQIILSGGVASGGLVTTFYGSRTIEAGGLAVSGTVIGFEYVRGITSGTSLSGGQQYVSSGGIASGTTIFSGGIQNILSGGVASGTIVSRGSQTVSNGGVAFGTNVNGLFSNQTIQNGGIASGTIVGSSNSQNVIGSGLAIDTTVLSGGNEYIQSGGVVSGLTISAGGSGIVYQGGALAGVVAINGALAFQGGTLSVNIAGTGSVVASGGNLLVQNVGTFTGGFVATSGSTLEFGANVLPASNALSFTGYNAGISVHGTSMPTNTLTGWTYGDKIDLADVAYSMSTSAQLLAGNVLSVSAGAQTYNFNLDPALNYAGATFTITADYASGTFVTAQSIGVVSGGQIVSGAVLSAGYFQTVFGTAVSTIVNSAGRQDVMSGGIASGTFVSSGGSQWISAGGTAIGGTATNGGTKYVLAGGVASGGLLSGGTEYVTGSSFAETIAGTNIQQYVQSGAFASGTILSQGAIQSVAAGGSAAVTTVGLNTLQTVAGSASGTIVSGGQQYVYPGGSATNTTLVSGTQAIASGTATSTTVGVSATQSVGFAGVAIGNTITSGGTQRVASGGVASNTTVSSGGAAFISSGGTASGLTVASGATATLSGGSLAGAIVDSGTIVLASGTTLSAAITGAGSIVASGGSVIVQSVGAFAGGFIVSSGTTLEFTSGSVPGGNAVTFAGANATLQIDGVAMPTNTVKGLIAGDNIDFAGISYSASGTAQLIAGNVLRVTANGSTYNLQLDSTQNFAGISFTPLADSVGGTKVALQQIGIVSAGQTVTSALVPYASFQQVYGTAVATSVTSGGEQDVYLNGIASGALISSGGVQIVSSGGRAVGGTISSAGTQNVLLGGMASATSVTTGGVANVFGVTSGAIVSNGGTVNIKSTGVGSAVSAIGSSFNYATVNVSSGGRTFGDVVSSSGIENILGGAIASGTFVGVSGTQIVSSGGIASGAIISGNITSTVNGNTTSYNTLSASQVVNSGGLADSTTIYTAGSQTINAGGSATNTILSAGYLYIAGVAIGTQNRIGTGYNGPRVGVVNVLSGGVASNTVISGSSDTSMVVSAGGLAINTIVMAASGTTETFVYGTTSGTILSARSDERVSSGGRAVGTTIFSGSYQDISSGGIASNTIVNSGGRVYYEGGGGNGLTVSAGGSAVLSGYYDGNSGQYIGGGTLTGAIINNGIISAASAGIQTISGTLTGSGGVVLSSGAYLLVAGGNAFTGGFVVSANATLELASGGAAGSGSITFAGTSATLKIDGTAMPTNVISGLAFPDLIDLAGVSYSTSATATISGSNIVQVTNGGTTYSLRLDPSLNLSGYTVQLSADSLGGTNVALLQLLTVSAGQTVSNLTLGAGTFQKVYGSAITTIVNSGSEQDVFSGGYTKSTILNAGTQIVSGGLASSTTINSGGVQTVLSGGIASSTLISSGGVQYISAGAAASATTLGPGYALQYVSSGGLAWGTMLNSGTYQYVSSGGVASGSIVNSGASVTVLSGGSMTDLMINGGSVSLNSGSLVGGFVSLNGGYLTTYQALGSGFSYISGGLTTYAAINSLTIGSGSYLQLNAGGSGHVVSGGSLYVGRGVATGTIVSAGSAGANYGGVLSGTILRGTGTESITVSGTAIGTTVSAGTSQTVQYQSSLASGTTVLTGGWQYVYSGGRAVGTILSGGSASIFSSGSTASGIQVLNGGYQFVFSSGTASGTVVSSGGELDVYQSGSLATGTIVSAGGLAFVYSGAVASGTKIVGSGARERVLSGGTAIGTTVSSGGYQAVYSAGIATGTIISSGGSQLVYSTGVASGAIVSSGGYQEVYSAGSATGTIVSSGGIHYVDSGGTASATQVNGGVQYVSLGGVATGTTAASGGYQQVESGGTASATTISAGGSGYVGSGGTANGATVTSGTLSVYSGGVASGVTVNAGGIGYFWSDGVVSNLVVNGSGSAYFYTAGVGTNVTVNSGGYLDLATAGRINNATIASGGSAFASGTSVLSGVTISSGGVLTTQTGGVLSGSIVDNGLLVLNTALAGTLTGSGTLQLYGVAYTVGPTPTFSGTLLVTNGGSDTITSGGIVRGTIVSSGSGEYVQSGAIASGTQVTGSGALQQVLSTGIARGTMLDTSGTQNVFSGGIASGTVVGNGGLAYAFSGGVASGTIVSSGGLQSVNVGGLLVSTTVGNGGSLFALSGGIASATSIAAGGAVSAYAGGIVSGATIDNGTLTFGSGGAFSGSLSGSGSLVISGGGTLVLSGASAFTGSVSINQSTLELVSGSALGAASIAFVGGGLLRIDDAGIPTAAISGIGTSYIDFRGISFSASGTIGLVTGNILRFTENSVSYDIHLDPTFNFSGSTFSLGADSGTGTLVTLSVAFPAPILALSNDTGISASDRITQDATLSGTSLAGATITIYDGETSLGTTSANGAGAWSFAPTGLSQGAHSFAATATRDGQTSAASTTLAVTFDTVAPTLVITSDKAALKAGETALITFTFSEDPGTSFTASDFMVTGGALGALSGTGLTRTAAFTPAANTNGGTASITVATATYTDLAGNAGGAGASPSLTFDTLAPTLTITSDRATLKSGETGVITFTFSEDPGGSFTASDLTITGGALGALSGTGLTRSATFTPTANTNAGVASITVAAGTYTDAAGNGGGAGASPSLTFDTQAPSLAITSDKNALKAGEAATITFTFSEDPGSTFTFSDAVATGGTLGALSGTGLTRTATFTPATNTNGGTASITVAAGTYFDAAGNAGGAGASPSVTFDTLAPTLSITSSASQVKAGETATITFTFSEDPGASFTSADITVTGGSLGALSGSGLVRTATFTPASNLNGPASITVDAAAYTDVAGNTGGAGASPSITVSTVPPTVSSITRVGAATNNATSEQFTVTFSDDVTGVDASDFTTTKTGTVAPSVSSVSGSGKTYVVTVSAATGDGTLRLDLKSSGTGIQSAAGVAIATGFTGGDVYTLDHTVPRITGVVQTPSSGNLTNAATVVLKLATSEAVTVTGAPTLVLNDGGTATYNAAQSTSTSLAFVYTVGAHDSAVSSLSATSVGLAGGSIVDAAGNAANLSLSGLSQAGPAIAPVNHAPTVTAASLTLTHAQTAAGIAASSLITVTDSDGDAITSYDFYDVGAGGGHLALNGVTQAASAILTYTPAQLAQLTYVPGSATDTLVVRASDGSAVGAFVAFTVTPGPNAAPVVTASNKTLTHGQTNIAASALVSATDSDGDPIKSYDFYDVGNGGGHLSLNGVTQANAAILTYTAAQLAQLTYVPGSATDTLLVRASDGSAAGAFTSFTVTPGPNAAPTVTAQNISLARGQTSVAASSLFTATDPDGDTISSFQLYDVGTGGGHLVLNGVTQASSTILTYSAAQLAQLTYVPGSATDTLYVQASDGSASSGFTSFNVSPPVNHAPTVTAANKTLTHGQTNIAVSSLFTATDSDGDTVASYSLYDVGTGGGYLALSGVKQASTTILTYTAAQLAQLTYVPGSAVDTLYVGASDGSAASAYTSFTVTPGPNNAPIITAPNKTLTHSQTIGGVAASSLITATDSDSDPILSYDFYDVGSGGGHLALNGVTQASAAILTFTASQLSQLTYQPGSATDTLYVRAGDGSAVGAFTSFTVTPGPDAAPVVTATSKTLTHAQTISGVAASTFFTATDADNDPILSYDFYDLGSGGGHLALNGVTQASGAILTYTASQLSQLTYRAGSATDTLYVRASDGSASGAFASFTVTPGPDQAPTVTASNKNQTHGTSVLASSLFTTNDLDGDPIASYSFYDVGSAGAHFSLNGTNQPTGAIFDITAAQLGGLTYTAGTGTADTIYVRASDGAQQSAFTQFAVTPT